MFKKIVSDLIGSGLTEKQIAEKVSTSQSSINRLRHGKHEPSWRLGDGLMRLHSERCAKAAQAA